MGAATCGRRALAHSIATARAATDRLTDGEALVVAGFVTTLLDEWNIDAMFTELVGRPQGLLARRYPQAIAVALALRHRLAT